jgi:MFS family permease
MRESARQAREARCAMSGEAVEKSERAARATGEGSAVTRPRPAYGRNFWTVFAASFALNSAANLFVLFPLFVVELGGGATAIGAIVGTGSLAALLARPGAGFAIDRRGRKWTALWCLVLDAFAIALYLPIKGLGWSIYTVRMVHGAIEGTARVALFAMVYDILPEGRQGEGMSIFSLCGMGSAVFGPFLGEMLIRHTGFEGFFLASVALVAISAFTTSTLPNDGRLAQSAAGDENNAVVGYGAMLADRRLRPLWIVTLLFSLAISSRGSFLAPIAYARGIRDVAVYFAIYSVTAVAARLATGRVIDRIGLGRMIVPSLVTLGVGLGLVAATGHAGMLDLAAFFGGVGHGYLYPALSGLVISRTAENAMARSSTIYTSLFDLGAMAGPYVLGMVGEYAGYGTVFVVAGMFTIAAAGYFLCAEPGAIRRRLA